MYAMRRAQGGAEFGDPVSRFAAAHTGHRRAVQPVLGPTRRCQVVAQADRYRWAQQGVELTERTAAGGDLHDAQQEPARHCSGISRGRPPGRTRQDRRAVSNRWVHRRKGQGGLQRSGWLRCEQVALVVEWRIAVRCGTKRERCSGNCHGHDDGRMRHGAVIAQRGSWRGRHLAGRSGRLRGFTVVSPFLLAFAFIGATIYLTHPDSE